VSRSRIFLPGIRASGHHGANPGERNEPQELVVDLDLEVEVAGDEIGTTADYRRLAQVARETVEGESFALMESLAEAIAVAALAHPHVRRATAVVHKPNAARSIGIDGVAVASTLPATDEG
jgi:dihydroneopterin aldolase